MIRLRVVGGMLIAAACAVPAAAQDESEFQPLFAWMPVGTALAAPPAERTFTLTSGAVLTPAHYGDFVLRFDYRIAAPGGSGALIVRSRLDDPAQRYPRGDSVALVGDPGSWIACEVRLDGTTMQVRLDGVLVSTTTGLASSRGRLAFAVDRAGALHIGNVRIAALPEPGRERPPGQPFGTGAIARDTPGVTPAAILYRAQPQYTAETMRERLGGVVVLDLVIGADGQPGDVRVVRSPHPDLTTQAIACLRRWRFTPATRDGAPVALMATMEMAFSLGPQQPTFTLGRKPPKK